jgi:hypothetical protein
MTEFAVSPIDASMSELKESRTAARAVNGLSQRNDRKFQCHRSVIVLEYDPTLRE